RVGGERERALAAAEDDLGGRVEGDCPAHCRAALPPDGEGGTRVALGAADHHVGRTPHAERVILLDGVRRVAAYHLPPAARDVEGAALPDLLGAASHHEEPVVTGDRLQPGAADGAGAVASDCLHLAPADDRALIGNDAQCLIAAYLGGVVV